MELLKTLIVASEKAANIARAIRSKDHLFELLVEVKGLDEANPRFMEDFKTLADVLIQEMVKYNVKNKFPELADKIFGEESNKFENKLGETIRVEVKETQEETADLLVNVLNGDREAAELLAMEVHKYVPMEDIDTIEPTQEFELNMDALGIWIDPIDATSEFIDGAEIGCDHDIPLSGLRCATILIGAFDLETGKPVVGVINRPFERINENFYQCIWGVSTPSVKTSAVIKNGVTKTDKIVCISGSEEELVNDKLMDFGYELVETAGAGHKAIMTILGLADAYVLSKSSTYFWDTCAPQAILNALGGDIVIFDELKHNSVVSVEYAFSRNRSNVGGVVAFKNPEVLTEMRDIFKDMKSDEMKNDILNDIISDVLH